MFLDKYMYIKGVSSLVSHFSLSNQKSDIKIDLDLVIKLLEP